MRNKLEEIRNVKCKEDGSKVIKKFADATFKGKQKKEAGSKLIKKFADATLKGKQKKAKM